MEIKFYSIDKKRDSSLKYVIICTRYQNKWIFVKHKERETWEIPAGHIETEELAFEAAKRELYEETGAVNFEIVSLFDYSVLLYGNISFGRIFFAEVKKLGALPESEIREITLQSQLPTKLTYPQIQTVLFEKARNVIESAF